MLAVAERAEGGHPLVVGNVAVQFVYMARPTEDAAGTPLPRSAIVVVVIVCTVVVVVVVATVVSFSFPPPQDGLHRREQRVVIIDVVARRQEHDGAFPVRGARRQERDEGGKPELGAHDHVQLGQLARSGVVQLVRIDVAAAVLGAVVASVLLRGWGR